MSDSLRPYGLQTSRFLCPCDFQGKITGMGCHFLLQGLFLIQGLNLPLPHWQTDSTPRGLGKPCLQLQFPASAPRSAHSEVWGAVFHFQLPWWLSGKESACNAGDVGSIPGSGGSPGGGHNIPLQYSCLENPTDRGAWRAAVHKIATAAHD